MHDMESDSQMYLQMSSVATHTPFGVDDELNSAGCKGRAFAGRVIGKMYIIWCPYPKTLNNHARSQSLVIMQ